MTREHPSTLTENEALAALARMGHYYRVTIDRDNGEVHVFRHEGVAGGHYDAYEAVEDALRILEEHAVRHEPPLIIAYGFTSPDDDAMCTARLLKPSRDGLWAPYWAVTSHYGEFAAREMALVRLALIVRYEEEAQA